MLQDIVNFPMDEFNDLLSKRELTEEQLNLCRDIRRRGKNKVVRFPNPLAFKSGPARTWWR